MTEYEKLAQQELKQWQKEMERDPSFFNRVSKDLQVRINKVIPEKVHRVITSAIENTTRAVLAGAGFTTPEHHDEHADFYTQELKVKEKIAFYTNTATAEGAITGAGGILLGLADFPLWLTIKMKMLFSIAASYGYPVNDYKERVFILHIFQLTFSSQKHRRNIYTLLKRWEEYKNELPENMNDFDWRSFQQEYRDYIDLAKLLQLIPGIGAVVGGFVNHRLTQKLGFNAMQAYRLRMRFD